MPPPIWRNGRALDTAEAIRRDLAGDGGFRRPHMMQAQASRRIEPERARLQVPVQPADRSAPRLLHADLRWENEAWWVDSIALEDAH
ncbi:hypothetical protein H1235_00685 [Pseudoxanthomonas sp. NC8]|nr:hypothetical protein H1235_00685 [Pseudoxanthomonas sp. NC8]